MKDENLEDQQLVTRMEDFARLKKHLDAKTSLTTVQFFTAAFSGVIVILFFGFLGILFFGDFWGSIFASVLSALAIVGMLGGMRESNLRNYLNRETDIKREGMDEYLGANQEKDT